MRNVQISEELFVNIVKYFLLEQEESLPGIRRGLEQKMDALVSRELYTKYKTAPSEADREKARREYLDRRGLPESFRWQFSVDDIDGSVARSVRYDQGKKCGGSDNEVTEGSFLPKAAQAPGRAQNLTCQVAFLIGLPVESAFALLLTKVTKHAADTAKNT